MNGLPTPTEAPDPTEGVRNDLQRVIESLVELGVISHDYLGDEPQSTELLQCKLAEFVGDARSVATAADSVDGVSVPADILGYIDAGRNPDIYSREFVELITKQNQNVAGQLGALARFRDVLAKDLVEAFPDTKDAVNELVDPKSG